MELLIVIVVIAILAVITIVAYNGIQGRAREAKISSDLGELEKAVMAARVNTSNTMYGVTGNSFTAGNCISKTDIATLPRTDSCWVTYSSTLAKISTASGININNLVDPWGRPYFIDENEGENGGCGRDSLKVYSQSYGGGTSTQSISVPLSGFSGCAM